MTPDDPISAALRRVVREELAAALAQLRPATTTPATQELLDKSGLARALGVSMASVDRFDRLGQPNRRIGDAKRYVLADVLAWHASRPPKPAEPTDGAVRLLSRTKGAA